MSYKFCPYCKGNLSYNNFEYICDSCDEKVYINPAPCVSIIPIRDNKILLTKRGIEPRKGTYDFIGGFVKVGETIEQTATRETLEETGLKIELTDYLGEYSEEYTPDVTYPLCFTYLAKILDGKPNPDDDVSELIWVNIDEIKNLDLTESFPTIKKTLDDFLKI